MTLRCDNQTVRLVTLSLFAALGIAIFVLEAQIPLPLAFPGIKLGFANIVTLFLISKFKKIEVLMVLAVRIIVGTLLTGQLVSLTYSLVGGFLAFATMILANRLVKSKNLWFIGMIGGLFHNIGQAIVAAILFKNVNIMSYFFLLGFAGIITGLITSAAAAGLNKFIKINV